MLLSRATDRLLFVGSGIHDLLSKAISFCSTPSVFSGAAEENLHESSCTLLSLYL